MSNSRLLILGAGGHGKVVGDCASASGQWSELIYFDDHWPELDLCGTWPVVGDSEAILRKFRRNDQVFVAIGDSSSRLKWLRRLSDNGLELAIVLHPQSTISSTALLAPGTLVVAGAVINPYTRLGLGCIINTSATVDHDCKLADGVHVCPGAHLAGEVQVGEGSWIGIGSVVCQSLKIGAGVTVGAGAAVVADVADGLKVVGVPARPLKE